MHVLSSLSVVEGLDIYPGSKFVSIRGFSFLLKKYNNALVGLINQMVMQ